jgi:hypothetical protein
LQAIIPTLFNNKASEDEEMAPPPTMSERARGKQKDVSFSVSTASRKNSVSVPPVSPAKSSVFSPTPPGALFMKDNDPIKFYVQADYFQRKDLVKNIKVRTIPKAAAPIQFMLTRICRETAARLPATSRRLTMPFYMRRR